MGTEGQEKKTSTPKSGFNRNRRLCGYLDTRSEVCNFLYNHRDNITMDKDFEEVFMDTIMDALKISWQLGVDDGINHQKRMEEKKHDGIQNQI